MTLKAIYNTLAGQYATANQFGSLSESHRHALQQIQRALLPSTQKRLKVLDFGVGDGGFLQKLHSVASNCAFTGIDISSEMIKHAREAIPSLTAFETSAAKASQVIPLHTQDLVLAHFINAYIPISTLFKEAHALTTNEGYFSLITTTYESFPVAQQYLARFISQESLLSSIVGHYYKNILKNTTVASGKKELLEAFPQHGFTIVEHERLHLPITINTIDELALFGIEGTWFLNTLSIKMLPRSFLIQRLKHLFTKIFTFPYKDTHVIDIVLAKKV